jgi:hypothetical protein
MAVAAQVQAAAVAKNELTWPEAKAQVHGDGTAARMQAALAATGCSRARATVLELEIGRMPSANRAKAKTAALRAFRRKR